MEYHMKYIILALLIITMSFGLVYAQSVFGIKGGMNISRITGQDAVASSDSHLGMHAGFLMQYNLMEALVLQPELLYTQKGYNYKYYLGDVHYVKRTSFDYIEMPVLVKLNVATSDVQFQPYVGGAVSYLVSARAKQTIESGDTSISNDVDVSDQVNNLAYGFVVGAEFVFMKKYILGGRYNFGLSNIYKDDQPEIGSDVQNGVFMLSLGYLFNK
jgi:hypothetical protein